MNGAGKTATVGKIANKFLSEKKSWCCCADTFRAAAKEQLKIWADRTNSSFFLERNFLIQRLYVMNHKKGPRYGIELLIVDTAGRLHNKKDLMDELSKIIRVIKN